MLDLPGAMIAEKMIEQLFGFGEEFLSAPVDDVDPLARVRMVKPEVMHIRI
jgi:hypothetical protein